MYARNVWYMAGWSHEFPADAIVSHSYLGERMAFYRTSAGELVALEDRCAHRFAPLSLGCIEGDNLRCMYHGMLFSSDGECVEIPGQDLIPKQAKVRKFEVVERSGWVWFWAGDKQADFTTIPEMLPVDEPESYSARTGYLDYAASHQLISANLLDFSHLAFVHRDSFNADQEWTNAKPERQVLKNGIQLDWWVRNQTLPPGMGGKEGELVDQRALYQYLIPGVLRLMPSSYPAGSAPLSGSGPCNAEPVLDDFNGQAVTPIDEKNSRYFFSWITAAGENSEAHVDGAFKVACAAFAEDKRMIEAQQSVVDHTPPERRMMAMLGDSSITIFERMMKGASQ